MTHCIDIHTHIVPESFPAYAGTHVDIAWPCMQHASCGHKHIMIRGKHYRTVSDGAWSTSRRLRDMANMGVSRQVLSPMPELLSYWLPLQDAKALIRYLNDQIASMVLEHPQSFLGLGVIPLQDLDAAIREMEYLRHELGFPGVEIASHVNGVSIGDPRFEPFFAAAEQMRVSVFVHALRPAGQDRLVGAFSEQVICFPGDIALACASMITGGIGARHPRLRIAFSHGGGAMPILLPRLMQAWRVTHKARESLQESPLDTIRRFWFDQLVFDPQAVRFLVTTYGASQVLLGSDYPFGMSDPDPVRTLREAGLGPADTDAVLGENAMRFLGLGMAGL